MIRFRDSGSEIRGLGFGVGVVGFEFAPECIGLKWYWY